MAKARAICTCATCGEEFFYDKICRNRREADSFEAWAAQNLDECNGCRQKRIQRERDAENRAAAEKAEERNLPELTGSPKQIAWANSIREKAMAYCDRARAEADENLANENITRERYDRIVSTINAIISIAATADECRTARFWIDNGQYSNTSAIYSIKLIGYASGALEPQNAVSL